MNDLIKVATSIRDAFHYDPGHSDLDNEQPIHISVPLGTWRQLSFILSQIERSKAAHPEEAFTNAAIAEHLRNTADHPASDLSDNEKVWLREAAAVFEDMDTLYSSAPQE